MNTNKIKAYAPKARREFIQAVTDRAKLLGLSQKETEPVEFQGDLAIIDGRPFPQKVGQLRQKLEERIERQGFDQVMEAMAYTWFNRFMALRYMELHDYLEHGYRVLSNRSGSNIPEILENAAGVNLPGLDKEKVVALRLAGNKDNELYRLLIIAQCNALHRSMPFLFESINDETELLLPDNLLHSNSPIRKMVKDIPEEDWNQVEIIGWIYQFYISEKKKQVIGQVVKSEDIPAATQLFTPKWIVQYLVQNTLGRKWLATYPQSTLRDKMEYYIEPAEQDPEVQAQIDAVTPKELDPEEITFLDPACGSGHILVEAYEVFKEIYLERGYRTRDIPKLILEKNLYGLEIDDRAAQMAGFALMMRALRDDRRILSREQPPKLKVMALQSTHGLEAEETANILVAEKKEKIVGGDKLFDDLDRQASLEIRQESDLSQRDVAELINLFKQAKTLGSLIQIPEASAAKLSTIAEALDREDKPVFKRILKPLEQIVRQAEILAKKYDCVVTNPPYMGSKGMNGRLKAWAKDAYPNSKSDLFAVFIERCLKLALRQGYCGMITMQSWMFLSSFENLRNDLLNNVTILSMAHLGPRAFDSIGGEVVSTTSFIIQNMKQNNYKGAYLRLTDGHCEAEKENEIKTKRADPFLASAADFKKIPGSPIAYWVSEKGLNIFLHADLLGNIASPRAGLATGDNTIYQRFWFEVSLNNIAFDCHSNQESRKRNEKWYPCNSGGEFRKWFGNNEMLVNWQHDGLELRNFRNENGKLRSRPQNTRFYFKPGITWTKLSSSSFAARFRENCFVFDDTGRSAFPDNPEYIKPILGLLCSKISSFIMTVLNPSMSFTSGDISNIPISKKPFSTNVSSLTNKIIEYSKLDWNSYETSWDFTSLPLLQSDYRHPTLQSTYNQLRAHWKEITLEMQRLEEENNRIFIEAYGLQDELTPAVPLREITLTCNPYYRYGGDKTEDELEAQLRLDTIKELISYSIGCMMGRYSLDEPGLIYAHSGNEGFDPSRYKKFPADDDGIVPVMDQDWFPDDAAHRFVEFMKVTWSPEILKENLKFVADDLGPKRGESPIETIRRYLSTGFFKDHLKTYKKRPIYWLFSSGKQKAFEGLVYLHRYNESTLSRMRSAYVTPLQGKFNARLEYLQKEKKAAASASIQKKVQKELDTLKKKQEELARFDEELRHYADLRLKLDLDDGVKVNYGKFGSLLAERKAVTGEQQDQ